MEIINDKSYSFGWPKKISTSGPSWISYYDQNKIEEIIEKMENERVPLEELLKDYEEGTKLLSICKEKINVARKKVEQINKDLNKDAPKLDELDENAD